MKFPQLLRSQLYFVQHHQDVGGNLRYISHRVSVRPHDEWNAFLVELADLSRSLFDSFQVRPYDGTVLDKGDVFEISVHDRKVCRAYEGFVASLAHASVEHKAEELNPNASVVRGLDECGKDVFMVSTRSPLMQLKHRFLRADHVYTAITDPVLTLSTKTDVVVIGDKMYFPTIAGAQMFVSESICRNIASERIEEIKQVKYLTGMDHFEDVALKGVNVRRFLGYNEQRVVDLKRVVCREKIANKFGIAMKGNKLDLTNPDDADRFIRVVCNRGMLDPFDDKAVEVSSSKSWEKQRK